MSNIALTVRVCVPAYSRARETACDHIGSYLSGDFEASRSALQMLGCGCRRLNQVMKCEPFIAQEAMVPAIAGFVTEIFRSHPRLTRRVAVIRQYSERDPHLQSAHRFEAAVLS